MEASRQEIFQTIILNARPGAGKSELIKYLKNLDPQTRRRDYHVGKIHVIDDFPFLWRWFEEDDILEEMGKDRIFSDSEGYFKYQYLWDLLIHLINLEYEKFLRDSDPGEKYTVFIEFSRGVQHGGYKRAYPHLSNSILEKAVVLYVNVSWEESLRKNRERFNPEKPDSILEHGIPDKKLEYMYSDCDFKTLAEKNPNYLFIKDKVLPYAIFENEDDVTTEPKPVMHTRLRQCLKRLWEFRDTSA